MTDYAIFHPNSQALFGYMVIRLYGYLGPGNLLLSAVRKHVVTDNADANVFGRANQRLLNIFTQRRSRVITPVEYRNL